MIKAVEEIRDIGQKDAFHPVAVHDIFARHGMAKNVQQDANKAFVVLMTQIAQDLAGNLVKEVSNFHGDFWYTNTCFICGRTSIGTAERFWGLLVEIPKKVGTEFATVTECIEEFMKEEALVGNDHTLCQKCTKSRISIEFAKL